MSDAVSVLRVSPVSGQGNLKGFADVRVGEVTICDCRIVQQPGQAAYISGPHKHERGRWWPLVKMSPQLRAQVQAVVLAEWQRQVGSEVPA